MIACGRFGFRMHGRFPSRWEWGQFSDESKDDAVGPYHGNGGGEEPHGGRYKLTARGGYGLYAIVPSKASLSDRGVPRGPG